MNYLKNLKFRQAFYPTLEKTKGRSNHDFAATKSTVKADKKGGHLSIMRYFERGFTLVEMLIVIGIVLVLLALAYPLYEKHKIRARFAEVASISDGMIKALQHCFQINHAFKKCSDGGGHPNDPNVLRAWAAVAAMRGNQSNNIVYSENETYYPDWDLIDWYIEVIIPGREDSSGNPLTSRHHVYFYRNNKDGSFEIHNPHKRSACVLDGWCTAGGG